MNAELEGPADDPCHKHRPLRRTRRFLVRAYASAGVVVLLAVALFGPAWTLWVPLMTLFLLSVMGLGYVLGVPFWREVDDTSGSA